MFDGADMSQRLDERRTGRWYALMIIVVVIIGGGGLTLYSRGRWWLPPVASVQGLAVDRLFNITLVVTGIVFVGVHALLAWLLWRYAAHGADVVEVERAAHFREHYVLELTYTIVPAVVLVVLILMGAVAFARVHAPAPPNALVVDVRAEQFAWLVRYPGPDGVFGRIDPARINTQTNPMGLDPADPASADDIVTRELHLVEGRAVRVRLRAKDVLHSFFVPQFRVKQDAVPGQTIETRFTPTRAGDYEIACAELCGVGHYVMRGKVTVESQQAFDAWLAQQKR